MNRLLFGCGYNGFNQLKNYTAHNTSSNAISTPIELCMQNIHSDNHDSEDNSVCSVQLSWDSIVCVRANGSIHVCGCLASVKSAVAWPTDVIHGALSWQGIHLITSEGRCLVWSHNDEGNLSQSPHSVAVGENSLVELDGAQRIDSVHSGGRHTVVITDSHRAALLGERADGVWGLQSLSLSVAIQEVSCGKEHVMLRSRIGVVFTMGTGGQGQLGHGDIENRLIPTCVEALEGVSMVAIAAGGWHSVAVSDLGDMYVWGWNERGQLGFPAKMVHYQDDPGNAATADEADRFINIQTDPARLELLPEESAVSRNKTSSIEIQDRQQREELVSDCVGQECDSVQSQDSDVEETVVKVSCGSRHTAALTDSGRLYTWGWNEYGQLGHGDKIHLDKPNAVHYFTDNDLQVCDVTCGFWNTVISCTMTEH